MIRAVIYARYSAGPRQTDQSIEGQIADCKRYAESHDMVVTEIYADKHISGKSTEGRDEFLRMIEDAKRKQFEAVIVWKVDRFGRDRTDIAIYKRELRKAGVQLCYAAESVPEGPEGLILESLLEGLAEYYSADLRQKVTRGMKESLKKGQWPGKCPYGYGKDKDKHVIIIEEEAAVIREIYRLCCEDYSIAEIVRSLVAKGIYKKNGSVYRILTNRHYIGEFEMMGLSIDVPGIVSEEVWNMAQTKLKSTAKNGGADANYLLSGKCICSECGSVLTGTHGTGKSGKKFYYYHCPKKCIKPVPKERYEMMILEECREFTLTDELIEQITDRIMELQEADLPHAEIKHVEAQIRDFTKRMNNLTNSIEQGVPADVVMPRIVDYKQKISDLSVELEKMKIKKPLIPRDYLAAWLRSFRDGDVADDNFCRRVIDTFIERVIVYPDHSVIVLNVSGDKTSPECSNLSRFVNLTKQRSNTEKVFWDLPYALLWVESIC